VYKKQVRIGVESKNPIQKTHPNYARIVPKLRAQNEAI
jgi:hypothetical protein